MITNAHSGISRRHFLVSGTLAAAVPLLDPHHFFAEVDGLVATARKEGAESKITLQPLRGEVSVLIGSGGNIAVLAGRDGKLLVDAGYAGSRIKIGDALAEIDSSPIKHLINTHWHFDHTDGNEWLHSAGATICAHENIRKHLSTPTRVKAWDFTFPPSPLVAIPTEVFTTERTLDLNRTQIALKHFAPAHTDGDISVHFINADILHVGDTFWNGHYPFIDYSTGGSIEGMIRATETTLAKVTEQMLIIPGHGPVADKSQLSFYCNLLVTVRDKIASLKKLGKSLDEVLASKPTSSFDAKWGGGFIRVQRCSPGSFSKGFEQGDS